MQIVLPAWFWSYEITSEVRATIKRLAQTLSLGEQATEKVDIGNDDHYTVYVRIFMGDDLEEYARINVSCVSMYLNTYKTIRRSLLLAKQLIASAHLYGGHYGVNYFRFFV